MIDESRHFIAAILVRLGATLLIDLWALLPRRGFNIPLAGLLPVRTLAAPRARGHHRASQHRTMTRRMLRSGPPVRYSGAEPGSRGPDSRRCWQGQGPKRYGWAGVPYTSQPAA